MCFLDFHLPRVMNLNRILAIVALLSPGVFSLAQTPNTASIRGQVLDQSRAAAQDAEVTISNTVVRFERTGRTDSSGNFSFSGLPVGTYSLVAHKDKFADVRRELTLMGGTAAEVQLQLSVSEVQTDIVVTGVAGDVRGDEPQLGDRLGATEIQQTPVLNRRITYLPLLNAANRPALNQGDVFMNQNLFTTNGSGRRQISFVVDGSTGNDSWGRQTIFTNIPQVAVQEMTVLENVFSAEYGATTGGVVNIVTKTGSNQYHGELLGLWRPSDTAAKLSGFTSNNVSSGNQVTTDSLDQLGASLSGPLPNTDRTHFFFAGEYSRQNRGSPVTAAIAPGVFVGHYAGWMTLLRVDHRINSANN